MQRSATSAAIRAISGAGRHVQRRRYSPSLTGKRTLSGRGLTGALISPSLAPSPLSCSNDNVYTRTFHGTKVAWHGGYKASDVDPKTAVTIKFIDRDGREHALKAPPGKSLLEVAHANGIDLEGACEGSLACSTCHVYISKEHYDQLEEPCEDEEDMLDLAFGLSEVSRLGCQIHVEKSLEGMQVTLPPATRNMAVDGYVPQPH